jgi:hypothetical protein
MTQAGIETLCLDARVHVRVANAHGREFSSRIEDLAADGIVITSPPGASAALLASGSREVELSWMSPRGRYEQRCVLVEHPSGVRQWRLRPVRRAVLIQRRRYVRIPAAVDVDVLVDGDELPGTTVDVSEGGFRVRLPRHPISELAYTVVKATIGGTHIAVPGYVLRAVDVPSDQTEAVIAFEANGGDAAAIRRFVLNAQLRARALRAADETSPETSRSQLE